MSGPLAVLVPLRPFGAGKTRLADVCTEAERATLAERWARRGIAAARVAADAPVVLVASSALASFARSEGCDRIDDAAHPGLAPAVDHGLATLAGRGFARCLVLMPDLPDVRPDDLARCLASPADVVLATSASGAGTNALVVPLPCPFAVALGDPESAREHAARAKASGRSLQRLALESLARDVDLVTDLRADELQELASRSRTLERGS